MNTITEGLIFKARCTIAEIEDCFDMNSALELIDKLSRRINELIDELESIKN